MQRVPTSGADPATSVHCLTTAGWTVKYGPPTILTLGFSGTVLQTAAPLLRELGCREGQASRCLSKLHTIATNYAASLLRTRRWLERQAPPPPSGVGSTSSTGAFG